MSSKKNLAFLVLGLVAISIVLIAFLFGPQVVDQLRYRSLMRTFVKESGEQIQAEFERWSTQELELTYEDVAGAPYSEELRTRISVLVGEIESYSDTVVSQHRQLHDQHYVGALEAARTGLGLDHHLPYTSRYADFFDLFGDSITEILEMPEYDVFALHDPNASSLSTGVFSLRRIYRIGLFFASYQLAAGDPNLAVDWVHTIWRLTQTHPFTPIVYESVGKGIRTDSLGLLDHLTSDPELMATLDAERLDVLSRILDSKTKQTNFDSMTYEALSMVHEAGRRGIRVEVEGRTAAAVYFDALFQVRDDFGIRGESLDVSEINKTDLLIMFGIGLPNVDRIDISSERYYTRLLEVGRKYEASVSKSE